ncbi:MAG: glycoside-pentoside-hexuronide (GPH):cation symporter [Clostridiales Family XIII bacterium]|jgi:GPH family glycoside/pentoside/hexuronide:cation symporter/probable glucitol transport protein GutA|nr:glycoside-pentoside-hexuronide (GPH):cation symporter [Clostridiales Family XIII bacterium]
MATKQQTPPSQATIENANVSVEEANVMLTFSQRLPYFGGALGQCLIWTVIMSFLTFFWTDVVFIAPGVVSAFLLITKLWDAVNDPIIGYLSDRTQTRFGRYRPWTLSFIPIAVLGFLTFTVIPGLSPQAQAFFSLTMYFLYVLAYTASEVPGNGLVAATTTNFRSRGQVVTFRMCGSYAASVVVGSTFLPMALQLGGMTTLPDGTPVPDLAKGFFFATLILTVIALPLGLYFFLGVKERVKIPVSKHKIRASFSALKGNFPFWLYFAAFFVYGITSGTTSARMYYWTYIYGDQNLMSVNITSWIGGMAIGSIIYFFVVKKVQNKGTPAVIFFILTGICNFALFFFVMRPDVSSGALFAFHALTFITGTLQGIAVSAMYGVLPDITEYTQWKYNFRISGFLTSVLNCSYKWSLAIGSALFIAVIGALGYIPNELQSETVQTSINVFLHLIPAFCHAAAGILMTKYKIDIKRLEEMRAEIAARAETE